MYALQMVKADRQIHRASIYVTLIRMNKKGYVSSYSDKWPMGPGRRKRFYKITESGRRALGELNGLLATRQGFRENRGEYTIHDGRKIK